MIVLGLVLLSTVGLVFALKENQEITIKEVLIVALVFIVGVFAFIKANKKEKELKDGLPENDELSLMLKYKAGYYAFMVSMYVWLIMFFVKDKYFGIETMIGGGILLSALIYSISTLIVKRQFNEK